MSNRVLHNTSDVISALRQAADVLEGEIAVIDGYQEYCHEFCSHPGANIFDLVIRDAIKMRSGLTLEEFLRARDGKQKTTDPNPRTRGVQIALELYLNWAPHADALHLILEKERCASIQGNHLILNRHVIRAVLDHLANFKGVER